MDTINIREFKTKEYMYTPCKEGDVVTTVLWNSLHNIVITNLNDFQNLFAAIGADFKKYDSELERHILIATVLGDRITDLESFKRDCKTWQTEWEDKYKNVQQSNTELKDATKKINKQFEAFEEKLVHYGTDEPDSDVPIWVQPVPPYGGPNLNTLYAPVIKQNVSGNVIVVVKDVLPITHSLKVRALTYNRFAITKVTEQDDANGTVVINTDNTLTITPKTDGYRQILGKLTDLCPSISGGETITLSYSVSVSDTNNALGLQYTDTIKHADIGSNHIVYVDHSTNYTVTITLPDDISNVYMYFSGGISPYTVSNITVTNGELSGTGGVTVSRYGKNLFDPEMLNNQNENWRFVFDEKSGYYTRVAAPPGKEGANGASIISTSNAYVEKNRDLTSLIKIPKGFAVTVKVFGYHWNHVDGTEDKDFMLTTYKADRTRFRVYNSFRQNPYIPTDISYTITALDEDLWLDIGTDNRNELPKYFRKIQVEFNSVATEYEPYKGSQTVTSNEDGTVNGLTSVSPNMTLLTENDVVLECEYLVDTKTYVDNKIAELSKVVLNS